MSAIPDSCSPPRFKEHKATDPIAVMRNDDALARHPLVLIAEHEECTANALRSYLSKSGLRTALIEDGRGVLDHFWKLAPDLVVLDAQISGLDPYNVLKAIKQDGSTPVVIIDSCGTDESATQALNAGADDYIAKPLSITVVGARIHSILRRTRIGTIETQSSVLRFGSFVIDLSRYVAKVQLEAGHCTLNLTLTEFRLLAYMARSPGRTHSRHELLRNCLADSDARERSVDGHVSNLRRKLECIGIVGQPSTVRGLGYRLADSGLSSSGRKGAQL